MTTLPSTDPSVTAPAPLADFSRYAIGVSLILGGALNGLSQYLSHAISGDPENYIRWGAEHQIAIQAEQIALLASILFLPIGFLGLAAVTRWRHRRLTAVAICLILWGMWGFHNILALGYVAGSVAPDVLGVEAAVSLEEEFLRISACSSPPCCRTSSARSSASCCSASPAGAPASSRGQRWRC